MIDFFQAIFLRPFESLHTDKILWLKMCFDPVKIVHRNCHINGK